MIIILLLTKKKQTTRLNDKEESLNNISTMIAPCLHQLEIIILPFIDEILMVRQLKKTYSSLRFIFLNPAVGHTFLY